MRPETLDAALEWMAAVSEFSLIVSDGKVAIISGLRWTEPIRHNGDIPAAIVEAVQEVWDQVNGKGGHDRT